MKIRNLLYFCDKLQTIKNFSNHISALFLVIVLMFPAIVLLNHAMLDHSTDHWSSHSNELHIDSDENHCAHYHDYKELPSLVHISAFTSSEKSFLSDFSEELQERVIAIEIQNFLSRAPPYLLL